MPASGSRASSAADSRASSPVEGAARARAGVSTQIEMRCAGLRTHEEVVGHREHIGMVRAEAVEVVRSTGAWVTIYVLIAGTSSGYAGREGRKEEGIGAGDSTRDRVR